MTRGTRSSEVEAFIAEVVEVCKRHKMTIGTDAYSCVFEICRWDKRDIEKLKNALDCTDWEGEDSPPS